MQRYFGGRQRGKWNDSARVEPEDAEGLNNDDGLRSLSAPMMEHTPTKDLPNQVQEQSVGRAKTDIVDNNGLANETPDPVGHARRLPPLKAIPEVKTRAVAFKEEGKVTPPITPLGRTIYSKGQRNQTKFTQSIFYKQVDETMPMFMVTPGGRFHYFWEEFLLILVFYTLLVIPVEIAFTIFAENPTLDNVDIFITCVFFLNIVISFRTAIPNQNTTSMQKYITDPQIVAKNYAKKWLWIDLLATIPWDLIFAPFYSGVDALGAMRLLRLFRVVQVVSKRQGGRDKLSKGAVRLLKMCAYSYVIAHWIGLMWFTLSRHEGFAETQSGILASEELHNLPNMDKYIRCIHWGFWSIIGIGGELRPDTTLQTFLCFAVMVMGVYVFASILGNISVILTQMDSSSMRFQERVAGLSEFMNSRKGITKQDQKHIFEYVYHSWKITKGLNEKDLLMGLPQEMQGKLYRSMHKHYLLKCTFLEKCSDGFLNNLCTQMDHEICLSEDLILRQGEIGNRIYLIVKGKAEIVNINTGIIHGELPEGQLFGEMILFASHHKRSVSVRALTFMEIITFNKYRVLRLLEHYPEEKRLLKEKIRAKKAKYKDTKERLQQMTNEQLGDVVKMFSRKNKANIKEAAQKWQKKSVSFGKKQSVNQDLLLAAFGKKNEGDVGAALDAGVGDGDREESSEEDEEEIFEDMEMDEGMTGMRSETLRNRGQQKKWKMRQENRVLQKQLKSLMGKLQAERSEQATLNAKFDQLATLLLKQKPKEPVKKGPVIQSHTQTTVITTTSQTHMASQSPSNQNSPKQAETSKDTGSASRTQQPPKSALKPIKGNQVAPVDRKSVV